MIRHELIYSPNYKTTQNYKTWQLSTISPEPDNWGHTSCFRKCYSRPWTRAANPTAGLERVLGVLSMAEQDNNHTIYLKESHALLKHGGVNSIFYLYFVPESHYNDNQLIEKI